MLGLTTATLCMCVCAHHHVPGQDGMKWHRVERSSGTLRRHVKLPPTANLDNITAACDNGVLRVTVAKRPEAIESGPRRIAVA
jgi:HSP20 family protein